MKTPTAIDKVSGRSGISIYDYIAERGCCDYADVHRAFDLMSRRAVNAILASLYREGRIKCRRVDGNYQFALPEHEWPRPPRQERVKAIDRVRAHAKQAGRVTLQEMRRALYDTHPATVANAMRRLVARGELRKDGTEYWV